MKKKAQRLRRAKRARINIAMQLKPRLTVYRSLKHIYAQIILPAGKVLVAASTLDKELKVLLGHKTGNIAAAKEVGILIAKRALKIKKTLQVAFDRSGFSY
jgi:large subunit ribosomal protein L18